MFSLFTETFTRSPKLAPRKRHPHSLFPFLASLGSFSFHLRDYAHLDRHHVRLRWISKSPHPLHVSPSYQTTQKDCETTQQQGQDTVKYRRLVFASKLPLRRSSQRLCW